MSVRGRLGLDPSQFRITRGALYLLIGEVGFSLVWLLLPDLATRSSVAQWMVASPSTVFEHGRVWTLVTSAFLEPNFLSLILHAMVMWGLVPTLERFWGTPRFLRFVLITQLAGTLAGVAFGFFVTHDDTAVSSLNPMIMAAFVAFGITYARQPLQFFGRLPLTGRQLMYAIIGFNLLLVLLGALWVEAATLLAAMGAAALMTSKWSPVLAWKRRKIARARAKLSVLQGGKLPVAKVKRDDHRFLN